ncbi:MAG: 30S ribosomal protein S6 [Rubripirellula sp.]
MNKTLETTISKQRDKSIVAKNTYETLLILDSNQYARDPGGVTKTISDLVEEAGGEVLVNRLWMEQKLAYPIDKHQKGTYWLTYFSMEGTGLSKLDRAFALCEPVLRQMTIKLEPRLVEPILANARGENIVVSSTAEAEETEEATADA